MTHLHELPAFAPTYLAKPGSEFHTPHSIHRILSQHLIQRLHQEIGIGRRKTIGGLSFSTLCSGPSMLSKMPSSFMRSTI